MGGLLSYNNYLDRIEYSPLDRNEDNSPGYEGGEVGDNTGGWAGRVGSVAKGFASLTGHSLPGPLGDATTAATDAMDGKSIADIAGRTIGKVAGATIGSAVAGPLGAMIGGMLGRAAYGSYNDGFLGDAMDTRSDEGRRDRAENFGYSRSQTADMADVDAGRDSFGGSGYDGLDPGLGESGYGLNPGLSDVDPYGGYNLGTDIDTAFGPVGRSAYDGYSDSDDRGNGGDDSGSSGDGFGGDTGGFGGNADGGGDSGRGGDGATGPGNDSDNGGGWA